MFSHDVRVLRSLFGVAMAVVPYDAAFAAEQAAAWTGAILPPLRDPPSPPRFEPLDFWFASGRQISNGPWFIEQDGRVSWWGSGGGNGDFRRVAVGWSSLCNKDDEPVMWKPHLDDGTDGPWLLASKQDPAPLIVIINLPAFPAVPAVPALPAPSRRRG